MDETSSLSSDPGMVSGTDMSRTTTSSSMCSSTGGHEQIYAKSHFTGRQSAKFDSKFVTVNGFQENPLQVSKSHTKQLSSSNTDLTKGSSVKVVQSGTLPMNHGSSDPKKSLRAYSNAQKGFPTKSKLRNQFSVDQVYSDSECQRTPRFAPKMASQQANNIYNNVPNNTNYYSSVYGVIGPNSGQQSAFSNRNAFTDSESVDSLNLNSEQGPNRSYYQSNMPNYPHYPLSKPGDLICEYETVNRIRETMSASPTYSKMSHQQPTYLMCQNPNYLNRNGTCRNGQQAPQQDNRPPIPLHMNKGKLEDQSGQSGSALSLLSSTSSIFTTVFPF